MKFEDIPQLTQEGSWQCHMSLKYLKKSIAEWIEDDYYQLQLNPEFQRGHVWTKEQSIAYLEFLFKGGKTARIIYFNKPSWQACNTSSFTYDDFVCVDGLQRLTAILDFLDNKLPIFGGYFSDFEDRIPSDANLIFNVNNLKTKKEVLQWYLDFNSAGTPHAQEEIERVKTLLENCKS